MGLCYYWAALIISRRANRQKECSHGFLLGKKLVNSSKTIKRREYLSFDASNRRRKGHPVFDLLLKIPLGYWSSVHPFYEVTLSEHLSDKCKTTGCDQPHIAKPFQSDAPYVFGNIYYTEYNVLTQQKCKILLHPMGEKNIFLTKYKLII